jgi:hypothetical protein
VWTQAATGAALTIFGRELDFDDLIVAIVNGWRPTDVGPTFWADCLLGLPIDGKLSHLEACFFAGPAI